ncbi:hypothetical protein D3C86_1565000 [compost metagenome]
MGKVQISLQIPWRTPFISFRELPSSAAQIFISIHVSIKCTSLLLSSNQLSSCIAVLKIADTLFFVRDISQTYLLWQTLNAVIYNTVSKGTSRLCTEEQGNICFSFVPYLIVTDGTDNTVSDVEIAISQYRIVRHQRLVQLPVRLHRVTHTIRQVFRLSVSISN